MTFLIQGCRRRDRMRDGSSAKAFQAQQHASTIASKFSKTRWPRNRSRSHGRTRSIGSSWGEQGGSGKRTTFGGTLRTLAPCRPARSRSEEDRETVRWTASPTNTACSSSGDRLGEGVQEDLHRLRADLGHDEAEGAVAVGAGGAEDAAPFEAPVLTARRTPPAAPPAMAKPALPADPHLV